MQNSCNDGTQWMVKRRSCSHMITSRQSKWQIYGRSFQEAKEKDSSPKNAPLCFSGVVVMSHLGIMELYFREQGVKIWAKVYQKNLQEGIVKLLNMKLFKSMLWIFQQDSALTHKVCSMTVTAGQCLRLPHSRRLTSIWIPLTTSYGLYESKKLTIWISYNRLK